MIILAKYIHAGWGSSGYYSKRTLTLAEHERAFRKGLHLHWNHPTKQELMERPERDLNTLAAEAIEDAYYMDHPKHGAGLYARVKVFSDFVDRVKEKGSKLSILANGKRTHGEAPDGQGGLKKGLIVERIFPNEGNNVDFVTHAGAGGKLLFEAATDLGENEFLLVESADPLEEVRSLTPTKKEFDPMTHVLRETHDRVVGQLSEAEKQVNTLQTDNQTLTESNAQLTAELREMKDEKAVASILAGDDYQKLQEHERAAVIALVSIPRDSGGAIQTDKLTEAIAKAAEPFLKERKGKGVKVEGLGEDDDYTPDDEAIAKLAEAMRSNKSND